MGMKTKGVLLSLIAVVMAIGMMGVAYARSESPIEPQCTYGGRTDFQIRDQNEVWGDTVSATWVANNMAPGNNYSFDGSFVGLRSNGNGIIAMSCDYLVDRQPASPKVGAYQQSNINPDEMAKQLIITRCVYKTNSWQIDCLTGVPTGMSAKDQRSYCDSQDSRWRIQDVDHDGRITFYDLKHMPLTGLPLPGSANNIEGTRFIMSVKFADSAKNDLQGDTFNLTMLYTFTPQQCNNRGMAETTGISSICSSQLNESGLAELSGRCQ